MEIYGSAVLIYHLGIMLMNLPILKRLKCEARIWLARLFSSMIDFVTLFPNDIILEDFLGGFIGPDNIQVFVHHAHMVTDRQQHSIKFFLALQEGFYCVRAQGLLFLTS